MNKFLTSSSNPKELSLTIKGAIVAAAPIIALVIKFAGGEINNDDIQTVANYAADLVFLVGTVASSVMMIVGIARKVYKSFR